MHMQTAQTTLHEIKFKKQIALNIITKQQYLVFSVKLQIDFGGGYSCCCCCQTPVPSPDFSLETRS